MNLGMLVGLGFGYVMFDKNGQKFFKKSMDKLSETGSKLMKTLEKEGAENEVSKSDSESS
ncbi:MAG: hypothetical protein ACRC7S_16895 [Cetobacterium sp.]